MIYIVLFVVVACSLFVLFSAQYRRRSNVALALVLVSLCTSYFLLMVYVCKVSFHLSYLQQYYRLPERLVLSLYQLPISKSAVLSLLNISCVAFLAGNLWMTHSLWPIRLPDKLHGALGIAAAVYLFLQLLLYDPFLYPVWYRSVYPALVSQTGLKAIYGVLEKVTNAVNITLLTLCAYCAVYNVVTTPPVKIIHASDSRFATTYIMLLVAYVAFFFRLPRLMIGYSSKADVTTYELMLFSESPLVYSVYPYILSALILVILVFSLRQSYFRNKLESNSLSISRSIDAANIPARTICHYLKNEVLALEAELDEVESGDQAAASLMRTHLSQLYAQLETIHHSIQDNMLELRPTKTNDVIRAVIAHIQPKLGDIELKAQMPDETLMTMADPSYLEQALLNLLENACDACAHVATERAGRIVVTLTSGRRWVLIDIVDNGCGIRAEDIGRIFTPFYTTKPATQSWGAGLPLTHRLIVAMGGRIDVESVFGHSATVHVLLPWLRREALE